MRAEGYIGTEGIAEVVWNRRLSGPIHLMGLRSPKIAANARSGQFVMIRVGEGLDPLLRRPFSICGTENGMILILYRVVGRGTRILSDRRPGESLSVLGPLGRGFLSPGSDRRAVLVAGGIGIAPLLFLAGTLRPEQTLFLAGFASAEQVIEAGREGLGDLPISVATEDGSVGYHGLVTDLLEDSLNDGHAERTEVFACGPFPMLRAVAAIARRKGVPCQVSLEATMACGLGVCLGCAVRAASGLGRTYWHVCQDGPVFDAGALAWEEMSWQNHPT